MSKREKMEAPPMKNKHWEKEYSSCKDKKSAGERLFDPKPPAKRATTYKKVNKEDTD